MKKGYFKRTNAIPVFSGLLVGWLVMLGVDPRFLHMLCESSAIELYPSMEGGGEGGREAGGMEGGREGRG